MNRIYKWIVFLLVLLVTANGVFYSAFADHDDNNEKGHYQKKLGHRNTTVAATLAMMQCFWWEK